MSDRIFVSFSGTDDAPLWKEREVRMAKTKASKPTTKAPKPKPAPKPVKVKY